MQRFSFIVSFIIFSIQSFAQVGDKLPLSIVEYQHAVFSGCDIATYKYGEDQISISICQHSVKENPYVFNPFEAYIILKTDNSSLPCGYFTSTNGIENTVFIKNYEGWSVAQHEFSPLWTDIYIQKLGNDNYSISGKMAIAEDDTLCFTAYGKIPEVKPEVSYISLFSPDDYKDSKSQLIVGEETIEAPFVFYTRNDDAIKVFFMDRILLMDKALDYAVSFEIFSGSIPTGNFTYKKGVVESSDPAQIAIRPAFFDKGKTEYPNEAILKINKGKRDILNIDYQMTLEDGRVIKGYYKGKVPRRNNPI